MGRFRKNARTDCRRRRGYARGDAAGAHGTGNGHRARRSEGASGYRYGDRLEKPLSGANLEAYRLAPALAPLGEPSAHGFRQTPRLNAKACLNKTFGKGKRIVEFGLTGEITHTEVVEPIKR